MDLFDRYLHMLRLFLPRAERQDIIRELAEEMRSQAADREAALGRPLTADDQADVLRQYGHPMATAARYRAQRFLIGPLVFPYYALALKVVLGVVLAGHVIGGLVLLSQDPSLSQAGRLLEDLIKNVLVIAAWLTILAALIDRWLTRSKVLEKWDPKRLLPPVPQRAARVMRHGAGEPASLSSFLVGLVLSTWWLIALRYPAMMFGPGAADLAWGPAMDSLYPVLFVAQLTLLAEHFARFKRPHDARLFRLTRVVWGVTAVLFLLVIVSVDHNWIVWRDRVSEATRTKVLFQIAGVEVSVLALANLAFSVPFTIAAVAGTMSVIKRLVRRPPNGGPAAAVVATLLSAILASPAAGQPLADPAIRQVLADRIDTQRRSVGIVIGIVSPEGRRVVAHGRMAADQPRPLDADSVFEIGSVTKIFTALLFVDMAARGEVGISDRVSQHLPARAAQPGTDRRSMTLLDLATHTAGLPFWPANAPPNAQGLATMATYTVDQLFEFAAVFEPPAEVGTRWAYSNTDAGLLGALLARRAGVSFETLIRDRITRPLRMASTAVTPSAEMTAKLASGHDAKLQPAPRWNVPALAGAGSLHSSVTDLLSFLAAAADNTSIVGRALPAMFATRREGPGFQQALGWMIPKQTGSESLILHNGATLGFASSVVSDPDRRIGVVVLSNSVNGVADLALHVLRPSMPLTPPRTPGH